ncbi:flagellar hook-associated protein FlgL [Pseudoduganella sp. RAF53_2]|uniref:flagellar hook-associated protein FlgL n=1 Tax=unclassified Pseudoduganella TaxID=2637179 RepID=UPI003F9E2AA2
MRISSKAIFDSGVTQLSRLQTSLAKTQNQLSSGLRVLTPADDPIASARALEVTQSQSMNAQFQTNRDNARSSLSQVDQALGSGTSLLQDIKTLIVNAGNGSLSQTDREALATELDGRLADLMGVANTADGAGGYLFAGYRSSTLPFTPTASGAAYQGDSGQRELQVGSSRQLPISASGASIFENNVTGNGTFQTAADPANYGRGGTGVISPGSVKDASQLTGHQYSIAFTVTPATPGTPATYAYSVTDVTTGNLVTPTPVPYKEGESIAFDGMQMSVSGAPANGDVFTVDPSQNQSIFKTVKDLIGALRAGGSGPAGQAQLTNALNIANSNVDSATDNMLSVRATVGANLKELDYLDSSGDDLKLQYATTLSNLTEVDPVVAISQFTQQQINLEAAQKSYKEITSLSLFNFI